MVNKKKNNNSSNSLVFGRWPQTKIAMSHLANNRLKWWTEVNGTVDATTFPQTKLSRMPSDRILSQLFASNNFIISLREELLAQWWNNVKDTDIPSRDPIVAVFNQDIPCRLDKLIFASLPFDLPTAHQSDGFAMAGHDFKGLGSDGDSTTSGQNPNLDRRL